MAPTLSVQPNLRKLEARDLAGLVSLHVESFRGFYLSQLGPRFLREYYGWLMTYPGGVAVGAFDGADLVGVAAGFVAPAGFYRGLLSRWVRVGAAVLPVVVRRPLLIPRLILNAARARHSAVQRDDAQVAELSSLAVSTRCRGTGVGRRLVTAFAQAAHASGADTIRLTTDADDNEIVNTFYQRLGFVIARRFEAQPGRQLNEYRASTRLLTGQDAK